MNKPLYIVHLGSLGDSFIVAPSVIFLRGKNRQNNLIWIGNEQAGRVFKKDGIIDSWHDRDYDLEKTGEAHLKIVFQRSSNVWNDSFSVIQAKSDIDVPFTVQYLQSLQKLLSEDIIFPLPADFSFTEKEVVFFFGSGSIKKNWDIRNYCFLANKIMEKGYSVRFIGGETEKGSNSIIVLKRENYELHLFEAIEKTYDLIKRAQFFIGNDCGLSHFASYIGLSGIVIYSPGSDPIHFSPFHYYSRQKIISTFNNRFFSFEYRNKAIGNDNIIPVEWTEKEKVLKEFLDQFM